MHILYISQYFPPEVGATQARAHEMARNWVKMGHQVTMLTEIPNHPSGIIPPSYKGKWIERSELDGIEVVRLWVAASPVKNFRTRMVFYLSFMVNAAFAGLFEKGPFDFIFATSPPLFVGAAALAISYLRRIPLVFEVRDLWPESAVVLGELKNPTAVKLATKLEEACYRRAVKIITVVEGLRKKLIERNVPNEKLILIENGANTELFDLRKEARERLRIELGLSDKFVVIYAGIFGIAQGLESVIEAARILHENTQIHFLMVGEGPKKEEILALIQEYHLSNVTCLSEQPREIIPDFLSAADAALVPLRKHALFQAALPSKMFDAWACRKPIILSIEGEAQALLENVKGGLAIPPEDVYALVNAILHINSLPVAERETMGENGRALTQKFFSRQSQAAKLAIELEKTFAKS